MADEKRERPDTRKVQPLPDHINDPPKTTAIEPSEAALKYAEDMRRRREASRRLPAVSRVGRDPFGGRR